MKHLWQKAQGKIKDRNSLWSAALSRRTTLRHPDLDSAIIRATSHDDTRLDYKNAQRVFAWVKTSPVHVVPFLYALSRRVTRTRSWVVALKSLILLHGVLWTNAPSTRTIGRLPFDLSSFNDRYSSGRCRWAFNALVRMYFSFSDQKSVLLSMENDVQDEGRENLVRVQRWQNLLDALLQIRPLEDRIKSNAIVLEAMDCVIIEIFDLYSKICDMISKMLILIYKDTDLIEKSDAAIALEVLQKAGRQAEDLSEFFEICREMGLLRTSEFPVVQRVPPEDIVELERIISDGAVGVVDEKATLAGESEGVNLQMRTVITDKWEVFEEDESTSVAEKWVVFDEEEETAPGVAVIDPFAASLSFPPYGPHLNSYHHGGGPPPLIML